MRRRRRDLPNTILRPVGSNKPWNKGKANKPKMPKKNNKRRNKFHRGGGRQRPQNAYLRPERFLIHDVIPWEKAKGTKNRWYYQVTLASLIAPFIHVYDEFRVEKLTATFLSDAPASGAVGCMTGILMDQEGFGDFGISTGTAWFKSIASFPGSKIQHRGGSMSLHWWPTEPPAREWSRGRDQENKVVATLYFADDGEQETEIGGVLRLKGFVSGRGRYYDVKTLRVDRAIEEMRKESAQPSDDMRLDQMTLDQMAI